jgi:CDGSH-type Zn-finger protein
MAIPTQYAPFEVQFTEEDTKKDFYWCTCGRSKDPRGFCDGSHRTSGTNLKPMKFTPQQAGTQWICGCKATKTPPYCDGSHTALRKKHQHEEKVFKYWTFASVAALAAAIYFKSK